MLGGRVKTLHPRLHAGILADLEDPGHRQDLARHGIEPVGIVVCNLYPFRSQPSVEMIDIGGVTLLRAAAKNWARVGVVVDPADYPLVAGRTQGVDTLDEDLGSTWPARPSPILRPTTPASSPGWTKS